MEEETVQQLMQRVREDKAINDFIDLVLCEDKANDILYSLSEAWLPQAIVREKLVSFLKLAVRLFENRRD